MNIFLKALLILISSWKGNEYQQAASGITKLNRDAFQGSKGAFDSYGIQYSSSYEDGYITWLAGGEPSWTLYHSAYEPDPKAKIGQRLIATEPMSIVLNVAMSVYIHFKILTDDRVYRSEAFGGLNEAGLRDQLPGQMKIDWVCRSSTQSRANTELNASATCLPRRGSRRCGLRHICKSLRSQKV